MVPRVPIRSLLVVAALAAGDYLLWTWSSNGNSDTMALISGLALALLIIALLWLVAVGVVRSLLRRTLLARPDGDAQWRAARRRAGHGAGAAVGGAHRAARRSRIPAEDADDELLQQPATAGTASNPASAPPRSDRVAA